MKHSNHNGNSRKAVSSKELFIAAKKLLQDITDPMPSPLLDAFECVPVLYLLLYFLNKFRSFIRELVLNNVCVYFVTIKDIGFDTLSYRKKIYQGNRKLHSFPY